MKHIAAITPRPIVKRMVNLAHALFFMLGVVTTINTSQIFISCQPEFPDDAPVGIMPITRDDHREQERAIAAYSGRIAILNTENDKLQQQVVVTRTALVHAYRNNIRLRVQLQRQADNVVKLTYTAERLADCDSLARTAIGSIQSCIEKNSLYN